MENEKRILFYFIGWLTVALCIFLIGVINADAATYTPSNYKAQLYDNINGSLTSVDTYQETDGDNYYYGFIGLTAYTSGGAWGISSPIPLIANHTYSMTVDPYVPGCGYTILSSVNRIGVGTSLSNAKTSYQNNTNVTENYSQSVSNSRYLQYVFTPSINASYIVFPYATTSTCSSTTNQLSNIVIEDLGESGVSQEQINTSLNNQTTEIQTSIDNSTNTITGAITDTENNINNNIDDMEQSIIDSNKETQETIKDQLSDCRESYNLFDNQWYPSGISKTYIPVSAGTDLIYSESGKGSAVNYRFYTEIDGSFIETWVGAGNYYTIPDNGYIKLYKSTSTKINTMLNIGTTIKPYEPYGEEICSNRIDETNDKLDNLQDSITDSSSPDIDGLADSAGWLPPGPLDSVLNLPLSLFNSLTTNLNKSCSPISIPLPFVDKNLTIPCINTLYDKIGVSTFITWLGVIVSGLMLYTYLLKLYKWIEDRISLNETHSVDNWGGL